MQFLLTLVLFLSSVWAHQSSLTSSGTKIYWPNPNIPLSIQTNSSDLSSSQSQSVILNSMSEWNNSSAAKLIFSAGSSNQIRFQGNFPYGSAVVGVTEVSYNNNGAIQSATVFLNDDYTFRGSPGIYPAGQLFLGDVVTHELGHLLGLAHSEVLSSSMFYATFSGQSTVSSDDKAGLRYKYNSSFGSIYGYVKGGNQIGILGAHVQAISRSSGEVIGAVSDEDGYFVIGGLDLDDTYYLYISPTKNVDSLPGYFANVQKNFCPGNYVGSFFSACGRENDGRPTGINLTTVNPHADVGTVSIHCSLKTDENYDEQKLQTSFSPLDIYNFEIDQRYEKAFVGWFRKTTSTAWSAADLLTVNLTHFNELSGNPKYVKFSLISFPFGSQIEYEIDLKKNGIALGSPVRPLAYSGVSGTYSTDYSTYIPLDSIAGNNIFEVGIRSKRLSSSIVAQTFPASSVFSTDQYLPYLLVTSLYELRSGNYVPLLDNQVNLSDNASCLDAPFAYSISKAESDSGSSASTDQVAPVAGCGTIEPPSSGPGPTGPLFMLGFLLTIIAGTWFKSRKIFLS
jgi:hypothetical protein